MLEQIKKIIKEAKLSWRDAKKGESEESEEIIQQRRVNPFYLSDEEMIQIRSLEANKMRSAPELDAWTEEAGNAKANPVSIRDAKEGDPIIVFGEKAIYVDRETFEVRGQKVHVLAFRKSMGGQMVECSAFWNEVKNHIQRFGPGLKPYRGK